MKYKRLRKKHIKLFNELLFIKGTFTDDTWVNISNLEDKVIDLCSELGFKYEFIKSEYSKDNHLDVIPSRKVWEFIVTDEVEKRKGYGTIIASFCGTVDNPMDRYDIIGYVL